jgi:hypothetical protein
MVKTTLFINNTSWYNHTNTGIEVGLVSGYAQGKHSHAYQVFDFQNPSPNVGLIGVNNKQEFAIRFKFRFKEDYAFAVYLDGINVSQKSGVHSLNEIPEQERCNYKSHKGKFIIKNTNIGSGGYLDRYNQKNNENRLLTFTTEKNKGINEILISDPSLANRIEIYIWQQDECDMMIDNFSPSDNNSPTKIGAGAATNQEYANSSGLDQPVYLGKAMFIHTNESNVADLGKALLSLQEIEKLNYDPMDRVPRT